MSRETKPEPKRPAGSRVRLTGLLLAFVTLLVYLPVWHHGFIVFDDPDYVTENRMVQSGLTWSGLKWAFTTFHASNWHPLTWLSHMLDCELFGMNPGAQHIISVLFHSANALLLFSVWRRMTHALWPAALIAAFFAWHPLHVESVAWIAERKDVLSTFFGLLALNVYVHYAQSASRVSAPAKGRNAGAQNPGAWFYWALFFFALGLSAKPMLVTLPFVLLLLDRWPLGRNNATTVSDSHASISKREIESWRSLVLEKWPFFALSAASCAITVLAQRTEAIVSFENLPLDVRITNGIVAYTRYLAKTFWPSDLTIAYPLTRHLPIAPVALSVLLLLAISVFAWMQRRIRPWLLTGWLWFLGMLVPVIGIIQVGGQAMADRYSYLPIVGILVMAVYSLRDLANRSRPGSTVARVTASLALVLCLILTWRQLGYWQNSEKLFSHAVSITTDNDIARVNLGVALEQEGRKTEALAQYTEALRINPQQPQAHNNLANLLADLGRREEALVHYREVLRLKPNAMLAHANFGTLLTELGKFDEARQEFEQAARLSPDDPRPWYLLGKADLRRGQTAEAVAHFREALRRDPNDFQSLIYLARILAADESPQIRNGAEAITLATKANSLTGGDQPLVLDVLAMAYAECGRFQEAQQTVAEALEITRKAEARELIPTLEARLKLYQTSNAVRESLTNAQALW